MQQDFEKSFKINEQIKAKAVRVIDENSKMIGVIPLPQALKMAQDLNLDLVEISPQGDPPVCKIINFGKLRYELQKKASESRKKQKIVDTKEIRMGLNIGTGDLEVKIKQAIKFVEKGDKVKIVLKIKGREITHLELAEQLMANIIERTSEFAKPESFPKLENKQMIIILAKK